MNTDYLAALGTGPPFLFVSNELSQTELLYIHEIVNHTHAILGSIALVQVIQLVARKAVTVEAVPDAAWRYLLTVFNRAHRAGFRFETVVPYAAWACLLVPSKSPAETAVHSAGSDKRCGNRVYPCRSF